MFPLAAEHIWRRIFPAGDIDRARAAAPHAGAARSRSRRPPCALKSSLLPCCALRSASTALAGCAEPGPAPLVGTLEWDRVAVTAELAEPVLSWAVAEGDRVEAGAVLLELDARRQDARIAEAAEPARDERSAARRAHARRAHRDDRRGARESRAGARRRKPMPKREYTRVAELRKRELVAAVGSSTKRSPRATSAAPRRKPPRRSCASSRRARGPSRSSRRAAAVAAARAALETLQLTRERLDRARAARRPRRRAAVSCPATSRRSAPSSSACSSATRRTRACSCPRRARAELGVGARFEVRVEGVATPFTATLRSIRSEPSFTPYYALAGDDASRLVYPAELLLDGGARAAGRPAGARPSRWRGGHERDAERRDRRSTRAA